MTNSKKTSHKTQKLFRFEIDQSVRIEELNRTSIIGIANKEQTYTISVSNKVKRRLQEGYRRRGLPKLYAPQVFTAAIIVGLNQSGIKVHELVIDIEYPGYETTILFMINNHFPSMSVFFTSIGRKSPAHYAAYGVYIKKSKPDFSASTIELQEVIKNGPRTVTPPDKAGRFAAHNGPSKRHHTKK